MLLSPLTLDGHTVNVTQPFNSMERKKGCHVFQWFVRVKKGFRIFLEFREYVSTTLAS